MMGCCYRKTVNDGVVMWHDVTVTTSTTYIHTLGHTQGNFAQPLVRYLDNWEETQEPRGTWKELCGLNRRPWTMLHHVNHSTVCYCNLPMITIFNS